MPDGRCEGAIELIASIFRLAVADYLGHSYSHDGYAAIRRVRSRHRANAARFFSSPWAAYLADLIGLEASALCREVRRLEAQVDPRRDATRAA